MFLKFSLAVNGVFFDETLKSTSKKIVNRRKKKKKEKKEGKKEFKEV